MRVLCVSPYLSLVYGGTARVVQEIARSLGELDVQVDVITTNANGHETLDVPLDQWLENPTHRVRYFPCWHRYDLVLSTSLLSWLSRHVQDYDIVHTHTLFSPLLTLVHAICRKRQVPYAMTPHGMLEPWAMANKAWKKDFYFNWFEKPALQHASLIQAIALPEQKSLEALQLNQTVLIPNGINPRNFQNLPSAQIFYQAFPSLQGKKLLLFLGRLDPKKGLDLLAPAFARALTEFPDLHLVIAGPDSVGFLPTVQQYFSASNCLDAVTFTGMLAGELKYSALQAAQVYIAPSYSEGFSISILEGMAAGLPCIITNTCNFEAARQVAHIVPPNIDAITTALLNTLRSPQESAQMGFNARQFTLKNYTWPAIAQELVDTYEQHKRSAARIPV